MFKGCQWCGEHGPCKEWCRCAKCVDPEGYIKWKTNNPDEYNAWKERQTVNFCDCPACIDISD